MALLGLLHVHQPFGSGDDSDAGNGFTVLLGAGGVFRLGCHRWGTALLMVQSGSRALAPEEEPEEDDGSERHWYPEAARSGGAQRWRTAVAHSGGAQRWRAAMAHSGGAQRWRAEVARRGGAQR